MADSRSLRWLLVICLLPLTMAHAGWNFDTAQSPEAARDLLALQEAPVPPAGSWLRIRGMAASNVFEPGGREVSAWPTASPAPDIQQRRAALQALRSKGYLLVALVGWAPDSWVAGVRPDQPLRRLPLDLREAAARCARLTETYGDLIDYWEILSEPDISFVEENPETYAAFLKACFLGFKATFPKSAVSGHQLSRVLCGSFALPPGPYFNAWAANDGLRYIEGFNYHFYGYAEDFTGVYQQFQSAVANAPESTPRNESVFQTQFYPFAEAWQAKVLSRFSPAEGDGALNRAILQARPRASEEPILLPQGRWLASSGTLVHETETAWEFIVTSPAPGPMRPAMAELPLPAGWPLSSIRHLAFEYRMKDPEPGDREPEAAKNQSPKSSNPATTEGLSAKPVVSYAPEFQNSRSLAPISSTVSPRALPVFLTEYGYGLLDGNARRTEAGREAQRRWFTQVQQQLRALGIDHALSFNLQPNYSKQLGEFGLLMDASSGPPMPASSALWNGLSISPALATLIAESASPIPPHSWTVNTTPANPVVLDFIADETLITAKGRCSYLLQSASATGQLIIYNFSEQPVSGEVVLTGSAWTFDAGERTHTLRLAAGERRAIGVLIHPEVEDHYVPQGVTARFREGPVLTITNSQASAPTHAVPITSPVPSLPPGPTAPVISAATADFEIYIRTSNGNLYQTWPRLIARNTWQWYVEPLASFTPAFFGRAYLPVALIENTPAALVFFFRPSRYPTTFQVRHASLVEFVPRNMARKNQARDVDRN